MELPLIHYKAEDYLDTASGNKINKYSVLNGCRNIVMKGKSIIMDKTIIRGDLANIRIGESTIIKTGVIIRPPYKKLAKAISFYPVTIGNNVFIEEESVVNAGAVGSYVHIGKRCFIARRAILKDCCAVADDSYVPPEMVVPSFCLVAGNPARIVDSLPECNHQLMQDICKTFYKNFRRYN